MYIWKCSAIMNAKLCFPPEVQLFFSGSKINTANQYLCKVHSCKTKASVSSSCNAMTWKYFLTFLSRLKYNIKRFFFPAVFRVVRENIHKPCSKTSNLRVLLEYNIQIFILKFSFPFFYKKSALHFSLKMWYSISCLIHWFRTGIFPFCLIHTSDSLNTALK